MFQFVIRRWGNNRCNFYEFNNILNFRFSNTNFLYYYLSIAWAKILYQNHNPLCPCAEKPLARKNTDKKWDGWAINFNKRTAIHHHWWIRKQSPHVVFTIGKLSSAPRLNRKKARYIKISLSRKKGATSSRGINFSLKGVVYMKY